MNGLLTFSIVINIVVISIVIIRYYKYKKIKTLNEELEFKVIDIKGESRKSKKQVKELLDSIVEVTEELAYAKGTILNLDKALHKDLIIVIDPLTYEKAVNVKVKTTIDKEGNTLLNPTIRRKGKNGWKEIPVFLVHKPYKGIPR